MTPGAEAFDRWIRGSFVEMNTELEEIYFAQENREAVEGIGDDIKQQLVEEGTPHIVALLAENNTYEVFDSGFSVLGCLGLYMAACRRHLITDPNNETTSPLKEASALGIQLGTALGVTPRFSTAHFSTRNPAVNGKYRVFTSLPDELVFLDYNTRGIFSFMRVADALLRIVPLGVSHPVTYDLLIHARDALRDVKANNVILFEKLDTDRFFFSVRPYHRPYRVGRHIYRGANAGDFAGINVIDLLLGLCLAKDASYSELLIDKITFLNPSDQVLLREGMRHKSLMNEFLEVMDEQRREHWYQTNLEMFLEVIGLHGDIAEQHHYQLVNKFIEKPATGLPEEFLKSVTASGPPLDVMLRSLEDLRDKRLAADRDDIPTRYADVQRLKASLD